MPDFILFAQHGWADNNYGIMKLAEAVACPQNLTQNLTENLTENLAQTLNQTLNQTLIVAPNLGWLKTWLKMAPLIKKVETIAISILTKYPHSPIKIIGHSMGGLIWLEILHRHPEWWQKVHSLVLIGSPVAGSELGKMLDPLRIAVGADLGINRLKIATLIAQKIPTLSIAGDINGKSDGTVTIASTQISYSKSKILLGISHPRLKNHGRVATVIREFWSEL